MYLERFYDENLAQASYLVGCQKTGQAIVIDPAREVDIYLEAAEKQGMEIVATTETHIHADYISGSRELSHRVGAKMYLSDEGDDDWKYSFHGPNDVLVKDGDVIRLGGISLKVLHTPGHTPEHISFLLTDHPASEEPMGVFTGDFLFVGDVGRPDLLEKAAGFRDTMRKGAVVLYHSLQKFAKLPDHLQIWPAHGAGSACGKALGAVPSTVLGYEKIANWAFQCKTEDEFVEKILEGQPEPPYYFAQMKKLNKIGPAVLPTALPPKVSSDQMKILQEQKAMVVDLRGVEEFAQSHPTSALFLPNGKDLTNWAGWMLSYDEPHYLIVANEDGAQQALSALRSIGLDNTAGLFYSQDLEGSGLQMVSSKRTGPEVLGSSRDRVVDVRGTNEWNEGHVEGARHLFLGYLHNRLDEVPKNPILYCGSGLRSLIASSFLEKEGFEPQDIIGGYAAIAEPVRVPS